MTFDEELQNKFVCPKCGTVGGSVKRVSMSGVGLSKLMDIQHNRFIAVSCVRCGYTEFYNPEIYEGKDNFMNVLDLLFGS